MEESIDIWRFGEDEACKFLKKKGFNILTRNFRFPKGEIDIVVRNKKLVVFVEVKTRSSSKFMQPWEAVGLKKRTLLKSAAKLYIREHRLHDDDIRFDVISITLNDALKPEIEWLQDAFS